MSIHVNFGGRYRLQVFHGATDILKYDTGWFSNIITDNGLNLLGTGWSGGGCYVGTNGAPGAPGDTAITNPVGAGLGELSVGRQLTTAPYYGWRRYTAVFGIGAIVGTIAEVGVGVSATNLFSRAQLLDVNGSPVTLTLGGIDRLTITYELRQYFDLTDQSFNVAIDGVSTACLKRPLLQDGYPYGSYHDSMMPHFGATAGRVSGSAYTGGTAPYVGADWLTPPSGTAYGLGYYNEVAYVAGSHKITHVMGLTAAQGAITNITALVSSALGTFAGHARFGGSWQFSFDPPLSKTQYEDLRLTFETSWGRA